MDDEQHSPAVLYFGPAVLYAATRPRWWRPRWVLALSGRRGLRRARREIGVWRQVGATADGAGFASGGGFRVAGWRPGGPPPAGCPDDAGDWRMR